MAEDDDDRSVKKAEPSRWQSGGASAHHPTFSAHKIRAIASSGYGEMQAQVREMMRTTPEDRTARAPAHVITLQDITRGLGLDQVDEQRFQKLVNDTLPTFTQKTQTQRIFHARGKLLSVLRDSAKHIDSSIRDELLRRAVAYWKRHHQTDYGKVPTVRFRGGETRKSMAQGPTPVLTVDRLLSKAAKGGKYYRRVATGNPKRPWKYYYTKTSYERAHGKGAHLHGPEVTAARRHKKKGAHPDQLNLFGGAPKKTEPEPDVDTDPPGKPSRIPLWGRLLLKRLAAHLAGQSPKGRSLDTQAGKLRNDISTARNSLTGPNAGKGRAWIDKHLLGPLTAHEEHRPADTPLGSLDDLRPKPEIPEDEPAVEPTVAERFVSLIQGWRDKFNQAMSLEGADWGEPRHKALGRLATEISDLRNFYRRDFTDEQGAKLDELIRAVRAKQTFGDDSNVPLGDLETPPPPGTPGGGPPLTVPVDAPPGDTAADARARAAASRAARKAAAEAKAAKPFNARTASDEELKVAVKIGDSSADSTAAMSELLRRASARQKKKDREISRPHPAGESGPSGKSKSPPAPTAPAGTARAAAQKKTKEDVESGEYAGSRKSEFMHRGEDLLGSARHKAMAWSGLSSALTSDSADQLFTRKFLEVEEPLGLLARAQEGRDAHGLLLLHLVFKKFPSKPPSPFKKGSDEAFSAFVKKAGGSGFMTAIEYGDLVKEWKGKSAEQKAEVLADYRKDQRTGYYAAFQAVSAIMTQVASSPASGIGGFQEALRKGLRAAYDKRRAGLSSGSKSAQLVELESLRQVLNATRGAKGKTSALGQIAGALKAAEATASETSDKESRFRDIAMNMMEGQSLAKATGVKAEKGARRARFDFAGQYDTDVMERSGPTSEAADGHQAADLLDARAGGKFGMRGIQYGKSLPDVERAHHLKSCADSFTDLMDMVGLPPGMASFNGKLGLALGARGRGGALAHYEPKDRIINLTRAQGAGSLAHEWGHFFDYTVREVSGSLPRGPLDGGAFETGRYNFSARSKPASTTELAMTSLMKSDVYSAFKSRVRKAARFHGLGKKSAEYITSDREMWARAFERHIQTKLKKAGRKNTYLVSVKKEASAPTGFWPTDDEVAAMAPHFEAIFKAFRESDLLHKAMAWLDRGFIREEYAHLVKGTPKFTIPRGR